MRTCYITFRSVTLAQRGEGILHRSGVNCALLRTPRWMEEQGCGYCLRIRQQDVEQCIMLLQQNQLSFSKIYLRYEDGRVEEMTL